MTASGGPRLTVRLPPFGPAECLRGFVLRSAEANGYPDARPLLPNGAPDRCFDRHLGSVSNARVPGSKDRLTMLASSVGARHLDLARPKVCAACLGDAPWIRAIWALRPYVACHMHGCLLTDGCLGCGGRLSWKRPGVAECGCGHDLRRGTAPSASAALVRCSALLVDLASGLPSPAGVAPVGDLDAALALLRFFSSVVADDGAGWRNWFMSKPRPGDLAPHLAAAAPILLDWTTGLHAWLASAAVPGAAGGAGLKACFGEALHRTLGPLRGEGLAAVVDEIRRWLGEDWTGGRIKASSPLYAATSSPGSLSARDAAKRLGINQSRVSSLVRAGRLEGLIRIAGSKRYCSVFASSLTPASIPTVSAQDVARRLGTTTAQIARMRARGILTPGSHALARPQGAAVFDLARVEEFERLVTSRTRHDCEPPPEAVSVAKLMDRLDVTLTSVLEGIIGGTLPAWQGRPPDAPLLDRTLVVPAAAWDLRAARLRGVLIDCVSVCEAAAAISTSAGMIPVLVGAGCLDAADTPGGSLRKRSVTRRSVEDFRHEWAIAAEVAAALGTSARKAVRLVTEAGIPAVVRSDGRHAITTVWRRSDVKEFLVQAGR